METSLSRPNWYRIIFSVEFSKIRLNAPSFSTLSLEGVNYQPSPCLPFCLVWQSRLYSLWTAVQQHFITHKQNMCSCVTWSSKFPHDAMVPSGSFVALIGFDCNKMKPQIQCYFWCSFPLHEPLSILSFLPYLFIQQSHFHLSFFNWWDLHGIHKVSIL